MTAIFILYRFYYNKLQRIMQKKNVDFSTFFYMAQSQNIYWRRFLTEAFISLPQNNIFVNTKNRRTLPPAFRGNKF